VSFDPPCIAHAMSFQPHLDLQLSPYRACLQHAVVTPPALADIVEIKHIMLPPSPREFKDIYVVFELMETDLHQVQLVCRCARFCLIRRSRAQCISQQVWILL